jgi:DNA-binding GntR family transcriptional regulator
MSREPTDNPNAKRGPGNKPRFTGIIGRRSLQGEATDRLRNMIVEGRFPAGAKLNEGEIASELGVSRTPIREALRVLGSEGLVNLAPGRGARVSRVSAVEAREVFEVISGLERHAVELATKRMSALDMARLRRLHERMTAYFSAEYRRNYFLINHEIHNLLVAMSGNATLKATHAALMVKVRRGRYIALEGARWPEALSEHDALMAAIADQDAARAGEIMRLHVLHTADALGAALASDQAVRRPKSLRHAK